MRESAEKLSIWPDDVRVDMGKKLGAMVLEGIEVRQSAREDRWARAMAMYQNEPVGAALGDDGETSKGSTFNLVQVKIDGLIAHVVAPLTSQEPYCFAQNYGDAEASRIVESACQFFAKRANIGLALADAALACAQFGRAFIRAEYKAEDKETYRYPCVKLTVIEPWDMVVYPPKAPSLQDAKLFGWRFQRRREEITALQESGEYLKDDIEAGENQEVGEAGYVEIGEGGKPIEGKAVHKEDEIVDLYTIIFDHYEGKEKKRLWATIEPEAGVILWVREYPWKRTFNVFDFNFKTISRRDGYWPANSIAQDLQSHQLDVNQLVTIAMDGVRANTLGYHFGPGTEQQPKYGHVAPGEIASWPGADLVKSHFPRVDISAVPMMLQAFVQNADNVARLSQVGTGGDVPSSQTATATQFQAAGQAAGKDDYAKRFGEGMVKFFEWLCECLEANYDDWAEVLGAAINEDGQPVPRDVFNLPYDWELSIASTNQHPGAQMNSAMMLLETAKNFPEAKAKIHEMYKRLLQLAERTGFTNAEGLQDPEDPIEVAARALLELGVPPELVEPALAALTAGLGQASGQPGMAGAYGVPAAQPGLDPSGNGAMPTGPAPALAGAGGMDQSVSIEGNF